MLMGRITSRHALSQLDKKFSGFSNLRIINSSNKLWLLRASSFTSPKSNENSRFMSSFTFAGAKSLNEIIKKDLIERKTGEEVKEIWTRYHEDLRDTTSYVLSSSEGQEILKRAKECPFFIQPIFRDEGFFNLVCQFQTPSYFLLAYLDDYKANPQQASPLVTFSVFNDLAESHGITLVRGEVVNQSISFYEGNKVINAMIDAYKNEAEYHHVEAFNKSPNKFDFETFIALQKAKWLSQT